MSRQDKIVELRKEDTKEKTKAVQQAIKHLNRIGKPVTISNVAREAKVGRNFIYKHEELKNLIIKNQDAKPTKHKNNYHNTKSVKDMLADKCNALIRENNKLRTENDDLSKHNYKQQYEDLKVKYDKLKSDYDALFKALMDSPQSLENFGKVSANLDKMKQA